MSVELATLSQPLSGQVAICADVARNIPFVTGYGVEIAMLIDVWRSHGPKAMGEADMGFIQNRFKPDDALDIVTRDVTHAMSLRGYPESVSDTHDRVTERHP